MMYKDKDKQREANRQAAAKRRAKGMTQGMTEKVIPAQGMTQDDVIPADASPAAKAAIRQARATTGNKYTVDRDAFDKLTGCYEAAAAVCYGGRDRRQAMREAGLA